MLTRTDRPHGQARRSSSQRTRLNRSNGSDRHSGPGLRRRPNAWRVLVHARPTCGRADRRHQARAGACHRGGAAQGVDGAAPGRDRGHQGGAALSRLSAGGRRKGPAALRSYRKLKVPAASGHVRRVGRRLPLSWPRPAWAPMAIFIGCDSWSGAAFVYDPWVLYEQGVLTNPNQLLAGVIGKGKSMLAKSLATRSIAFGRKVYVPGDPKGEWSVVARAVGGQAIELGGALEDPVEPARRRSSGARGPMTKRGEWRRPSAGGRCLGSLTESALGRPLLLDRAHRP